MLRRLAVVLLSGVFSLAAQYEGPRPPKPDLPYLVHADNLIPTESAEAQLDDHKGADELYTMEGANSTARTPLGSPVFLIRTEEIQADRLQCYRLQSKNGRREILLRRKKKLVAKPVRLNVTRVAEGLYKIQVDEILENGEYALSPNNSNQVFCFQVY